VLVKNNHEKKRAVASLLISALATGFASATISLDIDTDPEKRAKQPSFYGYVPDGGQKTVIYSVMVINSALLLLLRSFSVALLMQVKKRYFLMYVGGDMGIYLLQKVLRGDIHYWGQPPGAFGFLVGVLIRVIIKVVTDVSSLDLREGMEVHGRDDTCVGGCQR